MMKTFSRHIFLTFILATVGGVLLHFVYRLLPNPIIALIAPARESLWEHLKIIYWPFLTALLLLTRGGGAGSRTPWLLSLLVICVAMLVVGYTYHILLDGKSIVFDIGLFFLLMAIGFFLPRLFCPLANKKAWSSLLWTLTILLGGTILLFTFLPPAGPLFIDLSAVHTLVTIPY